MSAHTYQTVSSVDLANLSRGDTIARGSFKGRVLARLVTDFGILRYELQDVSGNNANVYFADKRNMFVFADFHITEEEMAELNSERPGTTTRPGSFCSNSTRRHRGVKDLLVNIQRQDVLTIRGIRVRDKRNGQIFIAPLANDIKVETAVERGIMVHVISGNPLRATTSSPAVVRTATAETRSGVNPTRHTNATASELDISTWDDSFGESTMYTPHPQPLRSAKSLPQPVRSPKARGTSSLCGDTWKKQINSNDKPEKSGSTNTAKDIPKSNTKNNHLREVTENIDLEEVSNTSHNKHKIMADNPIDLDRETDNNQINICGIEKDTRRILSPPRDAHIQTANPMRRSSGQHSDAKKVPADTIDTDTTTTERHTSTIEQSTDDGSKLNDTICKPPGSIESDDTCIRDAGAQCTQTQGTTRNRLLDDEPQNNRAKRARTDSHTCAAKPVDTNPTQCSRVGKPIPSRCIGNATASSGLLPNTSRYANAKNTITQIVNTTSCRAQRTHTTTAADASSSEPAPSNSRQIPPTRNPPGPNINICKRTNSKVRATTNERAGTEGNANPPSTNTPRKKYHTIDEIMRLPLAQLPPKAREVNVYGVVSWVGACQTSSTGEFYRQLSVVDETVKQAMWDNAALKVMLFFKQRAAMPGDDLKVGDVIRFHRAQIDMYNGKPQLKKSGKAFQWVYFPMPTRPIAYPASGSVNAPKFCGARPKHSPGLTANFTDFDTLRVRELVVMFHRLSPPTSASSGTSGQPQHTQNIIPTRTCEIRSLRHDTTVNVILQIVHPPRLPMKSSDFVANFFAWDGTSFAHSGLNPKRNKIVHIAAFQKKHMAVAKAFKSGDWACIVGGNVVYRDSESRFRITVNDRPGIKLFKLDETHPRVMAIKKKISDANIQFPGIPDDPAVSCAGFEEKCFIPIRDVKACESSTGKYKIKGQVQAVTHDGVRSWHRICKACTKSYTPTPQVAETLKCLSCGNETVLSVLFEIEVKDVTGSLKVLVTGQEAKDFLCIDDDKDVKRCLASLSLIKPEAHFECCVQSYELPSGFRVYQLFHTLLYASQPAH